MNCSNIKSFELLTNNDDSDNDFLETSSFQSKIEAIGILVGLAAVINKLYTLLNIIIILFFNSFIIYGLLILHNTEFDKRCNIGDNIIVMSGINLIIFFMIYLMYLNYIAIYFSCIALMNCFQCLCTEFHNENYNIDFINNYNLNISLGILLIQFINAIGILSSYDKISNNCEGNLYKYYLIHCYLALCFVAELLIITIIILYKCCKNKA